MATGGDGSPTQTAPFDNCSSNFCAEANCATGVVSAPYTLPVRARLAASRATLAVHLSIANLARVVRVLTPSYGADCPAVVAYRVSWPDELLVRGTLGDIRTKVKEARITRTALVLVGHALAGKSAADSRLYAADHYHSMRPRPA